MRQDEATAGEALRKDIEGLRADLHALEEMAGHARERRADMDAAVLMAIIKLSRDNEKVGTEFADVMAMASAVYELKQDATMTTWKETIRLDLGLTPNDLDIIIARLDIDGPPSAEG